MLQLKNISMGLWVTLMIAGSAMALTPAEIDALVSSMTLDEKVGQMTQAERGEATPQEVRDNYLGSILSGGGSHPSSNTASGWADMHDEYQDYALQTRLKIPILYGIDAVHGHSNVVGATIFPHNIGLGATRDPDLVEEIGRITAKEVRATGLEWTFAPCVAVVRDERWGRTYEGFGEHPELATMFSGRFVKGLQGTGTMNGERIVACAKHFAGDGGTTFGIDQGNTECDITELRDIHMPGYVEAIANNVGTIMPSFSSWNGKKMHEQDELLNGILKNPLDMNFQGFLISDWNAIAQLSGDTFYDDVVLAINAGVDMAMEPSNWPNYINTVKAAVNANPPDITMDRIDDAVRRILEIKNAAGLLDGVTANIYADRTLVNGGVLGAQEHRDVAREAVRKSLVLLKNDSNILPLSKDANVFVAGKNADSMRNQCGGWTIGWQGIPTTSPPVNMPGTTILEGIQAEVAEGGGSWNFDEGGNGASGHDVAIVVIGETPYAEGDGYSSTLALDSTDIACLNNVASSGVPMLVVLVSGRPMMISDYISDWDAFVAAWLPGTEGDGVAEVLFGDYDFVGKLPHTWPMNMAQIPINYGDSPYNPLFAYGYGLDYTSVAPAVSITNPSDGSSHAIGNVTIDATASDSDGSVTKVEFYEGSNYLGEDTSSPYTVTWAAGFDGVFTIIAKATDNDGLSSTDSVSLTIGTGVPGQQPYHGTPFELPTRVEAEDYDEGGPEVAYHDNDTNNNGGQYRSDEVDIEAGTGASGGYNAGWVDAGEWLEYTIDVPATGEYTIETRVSCWENNRHFHFEFDDGAIITGDINVPKTGDAGSSEYWNWTIVSVDVTLQAGTQIMRFESDTGGYNFDYFDIQAPMVTVPDVVGDDQVVGHQAITGAGLTLKDPNYFYSDTVGYDKIMLQSPAGGTSVIVSTPVYTEVSLGMRGDLNDNDIVNIEDLQIMAGEWLSSGLGTQADIAPITGPGDGGDDWVDFSDFAVLASDWQKSIP